MNAMQLIEHLNYNHRDLSIVLLVIEQREGREFVDRLLEEIPGPQVKKNAKYFVNRLRELCSVVQEEEEEAGQDQKSLLESRKLPGEKKYGKQSVLKES